MSVVQSIAEDIKTWFGTTQYEETDVVTLKPLQLVGLVPVDPESTDCRGVPCDELPVFDGDISSFLFQWAIDTSGIDDYRLEKWDGSVWTEIITGNTDNTLGSESGEKFTFGSFPDYPKYSGYKVDWEKIINEEGIGTYRFKVFNIFDAGTPLYSPPYILKVGTCDNKDNTFVIKTSQRGSYRNFNYTKVADTLIKFDLINIALGWEDEARYSGKIDPEAPEKENTIVTYGNYEQRLHLTNDFQIINIKLFKTTYQLFARLQFYGLRGDETTLTDSNKDSLFNFEEYPIIDAGDSPSFESFVRNRKIYDVNIKAKCAFDLGLRKC